MKILHVSYIYPPQVNVADGITTVVHAVTKELARKGYPVTVFASDILSLQNSVSIKAGNVLINNVNVHYFRSLIRHKTFFFTPSMIHFIARNVKKFDIIHIHDSRSFQGLLTFFFARLNKIPFVYQPHGSFFLTMPESAILRIAKTIIDKLFSEKLIKSSSRIIALTSYEANQYINFGFPKEHISIVPNGVDLSIYSSLPTRGAFRSKYCVRDDEKIILFLGRINHIKGLYYLIKAFAILVKNLKGIKLVIAGPDDGYLNQVICLIQTLNLSNDILLVGALYGKEKLQAYIDADIFVLPSLYEMFPISLLEAYACGKPVVASNINSLNSLILPGITGLLVKPANIDDLSSSLQYLLFNHDIAEKIGLKGQAFLFEFFSIQRIVEMLLDSYSKTT